MKPKKTPLTELKELRQQHAELTAALANERKQNDLLTHEVGAKCTRIDALERSVEFWQGKTADAKTVSEGLATAVRYLAEELGRVDP